MSAQLPWFRLYHRMVDDEKLRLLAFEDRWHFVALCCLKASGLIDEPDSDIRNRKIALKLGVQLRELDEISRRLREVDLVDELLNPVSWNELQYHSDNSTSRVKKFREKQGRNAVKRLRNVSVTGQETDTETDKEEAKASPASSDAVRAEHFVEAWNKDIAPLGKRAVRDLTPERRSLLKARIVQHGSPGLIEVLGNIRGSPFLIEAKGIQFDWVIQKKNFQKILEGNYNG
jgi:hypothetical protein